MKVTGESVFGAILTILGIGFLHSFYRRFYLTRFIQNTINNKVVLITGASSGLGKACAEAFYKVGANIILCARRKEQLENLKTQLLFLQQKHQKKPLVLVLDLCDADSIERTVKEAIKWQGKIDILVNNAGISFRGRAVETGIDIDRKIMEVNYFGTINLTKSVLPSMLKRKKGHIVTISSIQGKMGIPFRTAYASSKFALQAFFECLQSELAEVGIGVTIVSPSYIKTDLSLNAVRADGSIHGVMDSTTSTGMSTNYVAKQIVEAVARRDKEVILGPIVHKVAIYLRTLLPSVFSWIMEKKAKSGTKFEDLTNS